MIIQFLPGVEFCVRLGFYSNYFVAVKIAHISLSLFPSYATHHKVTRHIQSTHQIQSFTIEPFGFFPSAFQFISVFVLHILIFRGLCSIIKYDQLNHFTPYSIPLRLYLTAQQSQYGCRSRSFKKNEFRHWQNSNQ